MSYLTRQGEHFFQYGTQCEANPSPEGKEIKKEVFET
jgi:hypothetical protein